MNSGGSRKTTSSAFANIGGGRKQIFPYDAETYYTWEVYNINFKTSYVLSTGSDVVTRIMTSNGYYFTYGSTYKIDSNKLFEIPNASTKRYANSSIAYSEIESDLSGKYWMNDDSDKTYIHYGCTVRNITGTYELKVGTTRYGIDEQETMSRGTYSHDTIGYSRDAYPTNGAHTDGYWYVFVS